MSTKNENDWSEDEQKAAKEYERKVKELLEEREKYHKVTYHNLKTNCVKYDHLAIFSTLFLLYCRL